MSADPASLVERLLIDLVRAEVPPDDPARVDVVLHVDTHDCPDCQPGGPCPRLDRVAEAMPVREPDMTGPADPAASPPEQ